VYHAGLRRVLKDRTAKQPLGLSILIPAICEIVDGDPHLLKDGSDVGVRWVVADTPMQLAPHVLAECGQRLVLTPSNRGRD
jgi:hypothetical protein